MDELTLLLAYMVAITIVALSVAYIAYRLRLVRWLRSLRWALLVAMILTVGLIFLNVWVTARLMFISEYDLKITTALFVLGGLIALVFGFLVSGAITDGIREMARGAEQIAKGDFTTRLPVHGNDELAHLAKTFNWMAANLQEMDEQKRVLEQTRRNLIAWASHDLRTPLTAIRAMVEAMNDGVVADPATMKRYLGNMQGEIHNLSHLIDNLFELAQLDAGHLQLQFEAGSLHDLISDTLGSMTLRAQQSQIALRGDVDPRIDPVHMAADKVQRVLNNLLDNALRYTPAGGEVSLRAVKDGDYARVSVRNFAPNMPLPDASQIFIRFYRQEQSRAQTQDGYRGAGLGLAITRGFVEAHGGKIWVESQPQEGITFTFTLPRNGNKIPTA
jgi:signal transduction histidine kinase